MKLFDVNGDPCCCRAGMGMDMGLSPSLGQLKALWKCCSSP